MVFTFTFFPMLVNNGIFFGHSTLSQEKKEYLNINWGFGTDILPPELWTETDVLLFDISQEQHQRDPLRSSRLLFKKLDYHNTTNVLMVSFMLLSVRATVWPTIAFTYQPNQTLYLMQDVSESLKINCSKCGLQQQPAFTTESLMHTKQRETG